MAKTKPLKSQREPLFHVVKRDDMSALNAWLIRIATIVIAFILILLQALFFSCRFLHRAYREEQTYSSCKLQHRAG